jgi:hypothetical protein
LLQATAVQQQQQRQVVVVGVLPGDAASSTSWQGQLQQFMSLQMGM